MAKKRSAARRAESQAAAARAASIRREQERRERRRRSLVVTGVGLLLLALILVVGYVVQSSRDSTGGTAAAPAGAAGYALPVGQPDAPTTVTIYEDFLCPYCAEFEQASRDWLAQYAREGKVEVRYRAISILDDASNGTEYSTRAGNALAVVLDASGPGVAKSFHDTLFENQPDEGSDGLSDDRLVELAVAAGATRSAVEPGITNRTFEQWVANGTDAASKEDGYQGTPMVQVDGKLFDDYETMDQLSTNLKKAVDETE